MPLTYAVEYYNLWLPELHPEASLRHRAYYQYHKGQISANLLDFVITPYRVPLIQANTRAIFGHRAHLQVQDLDGRQYHPESLYVQAWNAHDVVFLDRFLRTLHALNHIQHRHDESQPVVMDVHLRHLAAVSEHHGEVFDELLMGLGLSPQHLILRLNGRSLQGDCHVQQAAKSFASRGYRLLAARPEIIYGDWEVLQRLDLDWISIHPSDLRQRIFPRRLNDSHHPPPTVDHGIRLWIEGVNSAEALHSALWLNADVIEEDISSDGDSDWHLPKPRQHSVMQRQWQV